MKSKIMTSIVLTSLIFCAHYYTAYPASSKSETESSSVKMITFKEIVSKISPSTDDSASSSSSDNPSSAAAETPDIKTTVKDYTTLITELENYISGFEGTYGIYFKSLTNNSEFGINENDSYVSASTVKVPINLYIFNQIAQNKIDSTMLLTYLEDDYETGTGQIQYNDIGGQYSVKELQRLSIEASDNVAKNMLIRYMGGWATLNTFEQSLVGHPINETQNGASPKDMAIYLNSILKFKKQYPDLGQEFLDYLENTEFNDRINKYLPSDVKVAHKIGTQVGVIDDIGIIFADKPFILTVMTKDIDESAAADVIGHIAKMIYYFEEN